MKRAFAVIWILALCLGLMIYCFTHAPVAQDDESQPSLEQTQETTLSTQAPEEPDLLYLPVYVQEPEEKAAWEQVAQAYAQTSGVEMTLVEDPEQAVVMILTDGGQVAGWSDRCMELGGSGAYAQLIDWDLAVRYEEKVCAIPTRMEGLGLICDTQLLAQYYSLSEITDFGKLREVVGTLSEAGIPVFATADPQTFAVLLASLPEGGRDLIDLYLVSGGTMQEGGGLDQILQGQAMFYLGSTAEYRIQDGTVPGILPICLGHEDLREHTLGVVGSQVILVRNDGTTEQIQVAMEFLDSLVVPDESGVVPLDGVQCMSPFRQTTYASNALEQTLRWDLVSGKECLACTPDEHTVEDLTAALLAYVADPTDENWAKFQSLI